MGLGLRMTRRGSKGKDRHCMVRWGPPLAAHHDSGLGLGGSSVPAACHPVRGKQAVTDVRSGTPPPPLPTSISPQADLTAACPSSAGLGPRTSQVPGALQLGGPCAIKRAQPALPRPRTSVPRRGVGAPPELAVVLRASHRLPPGASSGPTVSAGAMGSRMLRLS